MIKYIGSKRLLVPHILQGVSAFPESNRVLDLFSGTSRVARALKATGRFVIANDHLAYAAALARCYVQADATRWDRDARGLIEELRTVPPRAGYFTKAFCEEA
ncbi:MAG: DNA adenine methylase, partial [Myxococcales bacterium]